MSAERIAALQTRLISIDQARVDFASGKRVSKHSYDGHVIEYQQSSGLDLDTLEARTRIELARLQGQRSPYAARRMTY